MDIRDRRGLKAEAARSLATGSSDYKKLITLHTGVTLAVSLVLSVIHFLLEQQIGGTGGLGGVGLRSVLTTAQSVLQLAQVAVLPFWQFGWLIVSMGLAREQQMQPEALLTGFRRFAPYLRLMLLQGIVYFVIGIAGSNIATILFMMTPWAKPLMQVYGDAAAGNWDVEAIYSAMDEVAAQMLLPMLLIYLGVFLALAAPVFYRLRFAQYCLADDPAGRAFAAMKKSLDMTRRNALAVFRLDISFWWFYGLELLVTAAAYLDLILEVAGVQIPGADWVGNFGALGIYALCQLALYRWRKAEVDVTYAKAYESLQGPRPVSRPANFPWSN